MDGTKHMEEQELWSGRNWPGLVEPTLPKASKLFQQVSPPHKPLPYKGSLSAPKFINFWEISKGGREVVSDPKKNCNFFVLETALLAMNFPKISDPKISLQIQC